MVKYYFNQNKYNFISYIYMMFLTGFILNLTYNNNHSSGWFCFIIFYVFSYGFLYNGIQFINSNEDYIKKYMEREIITFKHYKIDSFIFYFDDRNIPRPILDNYIFIKTTILFLPAFMMFF